MNASERDIHVLNVQLRTSARIVEAIMLPNGHEGCLRSHMKVASLAQELYPDQSYLVFEDDSVLEDGWDTILETFPNGDLVYLGYTEASKDTIFGTHGMLISPRFRDTILAHGLEYAQKVRFPWAADWVIPRLAQDFGMEVYRPAYGDRQKWCYQQKGLRSQINGKIRT